MMVRLAQHIPTIGVISDDLTGAGGAAARLAARGLRVEVAWGHEPRWERCDAVVGDTRGRDEPHTAINQAEKWGAAFRDIGVAHVSMRVDTTLRGQPADELRGFLRGLDVVDPVLVAMPAHPKAGRITLNGVQTVRDHRGAQEALEVAPRIFGERTVAVLHHQMVAEGPAAIAEQLIESLDSGVSAFVADCTRESDFQIVAAGLEKVDQLTGRLITISSGALLSYLPTQLRHGLVVCVVASPTEANQVQLDEITASVQGACICRPEQAINDPETVLANDPPVVVVETISSDASHEVSLDAAEATYNLLSATAASGKPCAGLVVSGGRTASSVVDRLGAAAFEVAAEPQPLCTLGFLVGGPFDGLCMVTKGGRIGDKTTLAALVSAVEGRSTEMAAVPVRRNSEISTVRKEHEHQ